MARGSFLLGRPAYLPRNSFLSLLPCGIPERWPTHIPRLAPCRTPAFDSESRSMLFPAASTDTLVTRHFSRLAAPDAIARVELFYLPVILTTHAAFFLSLVFLIDVRIFARDFSLQVKPFEPPSCSLYPRGCSVRNSRIQNRSN